MKSDLYTKINLYLKKKDYLPIKYKINGEIIEWKNWREIFNPLLSYFWINSPKTTWYYSSVEWKKWFYRNKTKSKEDFYYEIINNKDFCKSKWWKTIDELSKMFFKNLKKENQDLINIIWKDFYWIMKAYIVDLFVFKTLDWVEKELQVLEYLKSKKIDIKDVIWEDDEKYWIDFIINKWKWNEYAIQLKPETFLSWYKWKRDYIIRAYNKNIKWHKNYWKPVYFIFYKKNTKLEDVWDLFLMKDLNKDKRVKISEFKF